VLKKKGECLLNVDTCEIPMEYPENLVNGNKDEKCVKNK
jgi:hypothetical protein